MKISLMHLKKRRGIWEQGIIKYYWNIVEPQQYLWQHIYLKIQIVPKSEVTYKFIYFSIYILVFSLKECKAT